jgi:pimeloyl-ACP methyl ester carboxylesterase/DNA-binding CsgD family transcriptional regulator
MPSLDQHIRFCTTSAGVRIAYSTMGDGPPVVWPPGWISHLQVWLENPLNRAFDEAIAQRYTLIKYDRPGCGLSDRDRTDLTLQADVAAFEAVIADLSLPRFAVHGFSDGGPCAIAYIARHPERVSRLILHNTHAGRQPGEHPRLDAALQAVADLARANWNIGSRTLADIFFPSGVDVETLLWTARMMRASATAEMAARLASEWVPDVRHLLPQITVPTLVMHRRSDVAIPFAGGRELASLLPSARFLPMEGDNHFPGYGDSESVLQAIFQFLEDWTETKYLPDGLTQREVEVLRLIACGRTNREIAAELVLSPRTVGRHITNLYGKIGARGKADATAYAVRHELN